MKGFEQCGGGGQWCLPDLACAKRQDKEMEGVHIGKNTLSFYHREYYPCRKSNDIFLMTLRLIVQLL